MSNTTLDDMVESLINTNIVDSTPLVTPREVKKIYEITENAAQTVIDSRKIIKDILDRKDDRLIVITGPCSIHDYNSAMDFAKELKKLSDDVSDKISLVMRAYFEKPRTGFDWEGLIPDPELNGDCDINKGYKLARKLLLEIAELGLPVATEIVDVRYTPQYIDDLLSWVSIGARTVESQDHRKAVSGFSMPVGFKNNTAGDIKTAVDAAEKARKKFRFPGVDLDLRGKIYKTNGNEYCHIVLRGGDKHPNYHDEKVRDAGILLERMGVPQNIFIDCSHGNSGKDYEKQPTVFRRILQQRLDGNKNIIGIMNEAHHMEGKQKFKYLEDDPDQLNPMQSITDGCMSKETNFELIREAYEKL